MRRDLVAIRARPIPSLPERVVPAVGDIYDDGGMQVRIAGYSTYDAITAPRTVFGFLSRLNGQTSWRAALADARAELAPDARATLDESLVRELFRVGALEPA